MRSLEEHNRSPGFREGVTNARSRAWGEGGGGCSMCSLEDYMPGRSEKSWGERAEGSGEGTAGSWWGCTMCSLKDIMQRGAGRGGWGWRGVIGQRGLRAVSVQQEEGNMGVREQGRGWTTNTPRLAACFLTDIDNMVHAA